MGFDSDRFLSRLEALEERGRAAKALGMYVLYRLKHLKECSALWMGCVSKHSSDAKRLVVLLEVFCFASTVARRRGKVGAANALERHLLEGLVVIRSSNGPRSRVVGSVGLFLAGLEESGAMEETSVRLFVSVLNGEREVPSNFGGEGIEWSDSDEEGVEGEVGDLDRVLVGVDTGTEGLVQSSGIGPHQSPLRVCVAYLAYQRALADPTVRDAGTRPSDPGSSAWLAAVESLPPGDKVSRVASEALDAWMEKESLLESQHRTAGTKRSRHHHLSSNILDDIRDIQVSKDIPDDMEEVDTDIARRALEQHLIQKQKYTQSLRNLQQSLNTLANQKSSDQRILLKRLDLACGALAAVAQVRKEALEYLASKDIPNISQALETQWVAPEKE